MKHKLKMGHNAVLEAIGASVTRARNFTDDVEWSAEDATRTECRFPVPLRRSRDHSPAPRVDQHARHGRLFARRRNTSTLIRMLHRARARMPTR